MQILSRVLDHGMELQQNADGAATFLLMIASALTKDSPQDSRPKYIIHQTNPML